MLKTFIFDYYVILLNFRNVLKINELTFCQFKISLYLCTS